MSVPNRLRKRNPLGRFTRAGRPQAAEIDFATPNLRGAGFPLYVSGAQVLHLVTMGPVAGTACNVTAISYNGIFEIGVFLDPTAIAEPGDFRDAIEPAFADIVEL